MTHSENRNKMKPVEFTIKEQQKLKRGQCQKCKKCSCFANLTYSQKELVK